MNKGTDKLIASMKAAAEKATPGQWQAFIDRASSTYSVFAKKVDDVISWMGFDGRKNAGSNAIFIAMANPENVLVLIAALEQAQQESKEQSARINELESQRKLAFMACNRWRDKCAEAKSRIAELEASKLSVKLPAYRNSPDMHTKQYYEAIGFNQGLDACADVIRAAGGTVEGSD